MSNQLTTLFQHLEESLDKQSLIKITLGNKREKAAELKNVFIKPLLAKNGLKLCFVYRYPTKDITKNFDLKESIILIEKMLVQEFLNADIFTQENDFYYAVQKNNIAKIITRAASLAKSISTNQHDKEKIRIVYAAGSAYLKELGITTAEGVVKKEKQDKYKQINKYIEIVEGIIKDLQFKAPLTVVDMGSGSGYLTFALYDYLVNVKHLVANITGIELRPALVEKCNAIAANANYTNLLFKAGTIEDSVIDNTDILIALHACDTATDEAIYSGIKANAKVIICAPCCHKQIRKQVAPDNALKCITKHGILLERQSEIITDAIRALLMEAHGYKTKVFEFIATEHTPKNILIVGVKADNYQHIQTDFIEKVAALKNLFGIKTHQLETLLKL